MAAASLSPPFASAPTPARVGSLCHRGVTGMHRQRRGRVSRPACRDFLNAKGPKRRGRRPRRPTYAIAPDQTPPCARSCRGRTKRSDAGADRMSARPGPQPTHRPTSYDPYTSPKRAALLGRPSVFSGQIVSYFLPSSFPAAGGSIPPACGSLLPTSPGSGRKLRDRIRGCRLCWWAGAYPRPP